MSKWPSKQQEIWFQAGVTGEQGRIIKLLEKVFDEHYSCLQGCSALQDAIALIKGEK